MRAKIRIDHYTPPRSIAFPSSSATHNNNHPPRMRRLSTTLPRTKWAPISITKTTTPNPLKQEELATLAFGKRFSDHIFEIDWNKENGWGTPQILPMHRFSLHPSTLVFHYAMCAFEGLKAYRGVDDGKIRLFRPEMNMRRMQTSLSRLAFPSFPEEDFLNGIKALVKLDSQFVPNKESFSMYLRPTAIATQESVGVSQSESIKLFVIASPVGPYYPTGFKPVTLLAETNYARAWHGGTGQYKLGANYAIAIGPQIEAQKKGYSQVLWLTKEPGANGGEEEEHVLTEVGTMNIFVVVKNPRTGEVEEIVTPPLDGSILAGVTRDSILALCREWYGSAKVSERRLTMKEVVKRAKEGSLGEAFGAGTAAIVSPIKLIHYQGEDIKIPIEESIQMGKVARRVVDEIRAIQYGRKRRDGWIVMVD